VDSNGSSIPIGDHPQTQFSIDNQAPVQHELAAHDPSVRGRG
jgi:hypothetical protein